MTLNCVIYETDLQIMILAVLDTACVSVSVLPETCRLERPEEMS